MYICSIYRQKIMSLSLSLSQYECVSVEEYMCFWLHVHNSITYGLSVALRKKKFNEFFFCRTSKISFDDVKCRCMNLTCNLTEFYVPLNH